MRRKGGTTTTVVGWYPSNVEVGSVGLGIRLIGEFQLCSLHPVWHALKKAYRPGMGQYLPDRLFWAREEADASGPGESPHAPDIRGSH